MPYRWSEAGAASASGTATVIFFAPSREGAGAESSNPWTRLASPGIEVNATADGATESETFITAVPGKRWRFIVGANGGGGYNAWITNNEGQTFTKAPMSSSTDVAGTPTNETGNLCCDPMSAADAAGDIWYGGLSSHPNSGPPSRV